MLPSRPPRERARRGAVKMRALLRREGPHLKAETRRPGLQEVGREDRLAGHNAVGKEQHGPGPRSHDTVKRPQNAAEITLPTGQALVRAKRVKRAARADLGLAEAIRPEP